MAKRKRGSRKKRSRTSSSISRNKSSSISSIPIISSVSNVIYKKRVSTSDQVICGIFILCIATIFIIAGYSMFQNIGQPPTADSNMITAPTEDGGRETFFYSDAELRELLRERGDPFV